MPSTNEPVSWEFRKWFLFRNVPKGLSWLHTLGFCLLIVFVNRAITGSILAMHYEPGANSAYNRSNESPWNTTLAGLFVECTNGAQA